MLSSEPFGNGFGDRGDNLSSQGASEMSYDQHEMVQAIQELLVMKLARIAKEVVERCFARVTRPGVEEVGLDGKGVH